MRCHVCELLQFSIGAGQLSGFAGQRIFGPFSFGDVFEDNHCAHQLFFFKDGCLDVFDRKVGAILSVEDLVGQMFSGASHEGGVACGDGAMKDFVFVFANQLLDFPSSDLGRGWINKRGPTLKVQAIDAFTGRIQNVLVTALELLQFLSARLDVQFQNIF